MAVASNFPAIRPSLNLDFANARALDPRITFSRASAATYYDGKTVAKAEENLFTNSENIAAWFPTRATITGNATTAPNGTVTAGLIKEDTTATNSHAFRGAIVSLNTGIAYTFSCYFKSAGRSWVVLWEYITGQSTEKKVYFDITNGVVGTTTAGVVATISPAGDGWFRCTMSFTAAASSSTGVVGYIANADNSFIYTGDGVSGVYAWGAQLEQRSQVTAYTPTTTQPITNYIPVLQTAPAGVPRFDHNPLTGESLGLLVEEQRTNLFTYSEQFDNAAWGKLGTTIASNAAVAPDGSISADKIIEDAGNSVHRVSQGPTSATSTTYALVVYAKAAERSFLQLRDTSQGIGVWFNLASGVIGTAAPGISGSITSIGNGWYRCVAIRTTASANTLWGIQIADADNSNSYAGTSGSGIYIWGAQLEAGSFPTSYIKTEASQVTRGADSADILTSSSWYSTSEHTALAEFSANNPSTGYAGVLWFNQGSASKGLTLSKSTAVGGMQTTVYQRGNDLSLKAISLGVKENGVFSKACIAYKNTEVSGAHSGVAASPVAVTSEHIATKMTIGYQNGAGAPSYLNGHIKRITYYPKRLSDAQLQALTA